MNHRIDRIALQILVLFFSTLAVANENQVLRDLLTTQGTGEAFAFYVENDSRTVGGPGSDQAYTNGFKFSYIYARDKIPNWSESALRHLEFVDKEIGKSKVNFGLSLGQQIFTPHDTNLKTFIPDDRPYAGWLYAGFAVSFKEEKVEHILELDLGVVGPSALGQQVQNNYHDFVAEPRAEGWDNQLKDEPAIQIFYQKRFKYLRSENLDLVPFYGVAFGNVQMGGHIGGIVRLGVNLPDNFGPSRPSSGDGDSFVSTANSNAKKYGYYVFAGGRGSTVVRNIFLDGNSFKSGPHMRKYPFTFETEFGTGIRIDPVSVVWSFVTRSPEFEQRSIFSSFASINVIYFL